MKNISLSLESATGMEKFLIETLFDLSTFTHKDLFDGIIYPWEVIAHLDSLLEKLFLGKIESPIPDGVYLVNREKISIGEGTVIEPGAYIEGPCLIGKGCQIRHGSYLRGNVVVGNGCVVGHATELKRSILLEKAAAPHFNYVGDSILGSGVNLGAGAILTNLRLDRAFISVGDQKNKVETNLKKLGAFIGDRAQIGSNVVINPGTIIGKGAFCSPCSLVGGYVPARGRQ